MLEELVEKTCLSAANAAATSVASTIVGALRSASVRMPSKLLTTVTSVWLAIVWRRTRWLVGRVITSSDASGTV